MQEDLQSILKLVENMHKAYMELLDKMIEKNPNITAQEIKKEFETGKKLTIGMFSYLNQFLSEGDSN